MSELQNVSVEVTTYTTDAAPFTLRSGLLLLLLIVQTFPIVILAVEVGCDSPMRRFEVVVPLFRAGCVVVNGVGPAIDWLGEPIGSE